MDPFRHENLTHLCVENTRMIDHYKDLHPTNNSLTDTKIESRNC